MHNRLEAKEHVMEDQKQQEKNTRDIATQTEPGVWLEYKTITPEPITKPKSKVGLSISRMFSNFHGRWNGRPMLSDEIKRWDEKERLLREAGAPEQKTEGSSASIATALAQIGGEPHVSPINRII